jgi:hypothetical protein
MVELDVKLLGHPIFPSEPPFEEPKIHDVRRGGSLVLFGEIATSFGVDVSNADHHHWRSVLGAAMLLDHLLDVEDKSNKGVPEKEGFVRSFVVLMQGQLRDDLDEVIQIRTVNYMARQHPERQQKIYDDVLTVDELTRRQRQTTDVHDLVDIRLTEADILSSLLALDYEENIPDANARGSFNQWVQSWSRVGYTLDSLVDLKEDFQNGESMVRPTLHARGILAKTVATESGVAVKRTPPRTMVKCAVNGFRYVIKEHRPEVRAADGSLAAPGPAAALARAS